MFPFVRSHLNVTISWCRFLSSFCWSSPFNTKTVAVRLRPHVDAVDSGKIPLSHQDKRAWNIERGTVGAETIISMKAGGGHNHHHHNQPSSSSSSSKTKNGVDGQDTVDGETTFSFLSLNVFDEQTKTPTVYKSVCRQLGKDVLKGKHATIVVVGEDGSGKTYTLQGDASSSSPLGSLTRNDGGQAGVIQLAVADLFRAMKRISSGDTEHEFRVKVSYLEIFNDGQEMKDLLWDVEGDTSYMVEDDDSTIVKHIIADSGEDVLDLLSHGNFQKKISQTVSTVFRLTVESIELLDGIDEDGLEKVCERYADFDFVDLAGSDSIDVSTEQNLMSTSPKLSQIIHLHDSEIALLACISPTKAFVKQAQRTLQLAFKAQAVTTVPTLNEAINDLDQSYLEGDEAGGSLGSEPQELPNEIDDEEPDDEAAESESDESDDEEPADDEDEAEAEGDDNQFDNDQTEEDGGEAARDDVEATEDEDEAEANDMQEEVDEDGAMLDDVRPDSLASQEQHASMVKVGGHEVYPSLAEHNKFEPTAARATEWNEVKQTLPLKTKKEPLTEKHSEDLTDSFHHSESVGMEPGDVAAQKSNTDLHLTCIEPVSNSASSSTPKRKMKTPHSQGETDSPNNRTYATPITDDDSNISIQGGSEASTINNETAGVGLERDRSDSVSWDTMMLSASRPENVGLPIQASSRDEVQSGEDGPPHEVTILSLSKTYDGNDHVSLMKELMMAQERIRFLEGQLEQADDLIEGTLRDLDRARRSVHDLTKRNADMTWDLKDKRRDFTKEDYETGEVIVESYWMLKAGVYLGLFAFVFFDSEYFLACAFFVWLVLETNMTV